MRQSTQKGIKTGGKKVKKKGKNVNFLVLVYKPIFFAETQKNFAPSHDDETVTFGNSGLSFHFPLTNTGKRNHSSLNCSVMGEKLPKNTMLMFPKGW